ncbi:hypothetical protein AVEN_271988-1 [Araneus ventricosus]|uniref:Uncharacterized protein n=1 Tax=Araneus ventricosus TaxID=182803 RepID=A0A4Y2CBD3_ARAVE|nr:hypothetical protein AVEN_271988-1 [Araneus ventricosus]
MEKRERALSVAHIGSTCNRSTSTICTILKIKDIIEEMHASKGVTRMPAQLLNDVEMLPLIWVNEKQLRGNNFNENIICEKVKAIFADIVKKTPGSSRSISGKPSIMH